MYVFAVDDPKRYVWPADLPRAASVPPLEHLWCIFPAFRPYLWWWQSRELVGDLSVGVSPWRLLVFHISFLCCFCLEFYKTWWNLVCFQHWCAAMFTLNLTMINNVITFVREPLMFQRQKREIRTEITFNFFVAKAHSGLVIMLQSHGAEKENVDHEFFIWWFNILDFFSIN